MDRGTAIPDAFNQAIADVQRRAGIAPAPEPSEPCPVPGDLLRGNPFIDNLAGAPRPAEDQPVYRHYNAEGLTQAQAQWDAAQDFKAWNDRLKAQRIAREEKTRADQRRQHDDERTAMRVEERTALEARLKRAFLEVPGSLESDWEQSKDRVIAQYFEHQIVHDEGPARAAQRRMTQSQI